MNHVLAAGLALALTASAAAAHATFEQKEAAIGSTVKLTLRVGHGCDGKATKVVRVRIPDGVVAVKPMPKAGWTLATVRGPYSRTFSTGHSEVSEGVKEISWTGELPDEFYDEFVFRGVVTDAFAPDTMLFVPVVQDCDGAAERWIEIPAAGQDADDLEMPAPGVKIVAPASQDH